MRKMSVSIRAVTAFSHTAGLSPPHGRFRLRKGNDGLTSCSSAKTLIAWKSGASPCCTVNHHCRRGYVHAPVAMSTQQHQDAKTHVVT